MRCRSRRSNSVWREILLPLLVRASLLRRGQRLDVLNQRKELFLADKSLERRHDRLKSGSDLRRRLKNRLADVALVRRDDRAIVQLHRASEQVLENRAPA